jgi:hypothetical protein
MQATVLLQNSLSQTTQQGLGIYEYGGRDQRLKQQFLECMESHYLYAAKCRQDISSSSQTLLFNGSATLGSEYIEQHFAGDMMHPYHKVATLEMGFAWMTISAGARSSASAEALVPISKAFNCENNIPVDSLLHWTASEGLRLGSEFILRDILKYDVPGKARFLREFQTKLCRGVGFRLSIAQNVFDGSGRRYAEFLGKPFFFRLGADPAKPDGFITAEYLLRNASGWGALDDVKLLIRVHKANVNARSANGGETALMYACRAGQVDVVEYLLKAGARADIASDKNSTPLHWLNSFPKAQVKKIAKLLCDAKGNPNAVMSEDLYGVEGSYWFFKGPPLMRPVASGNLEAVEALLGLGADPLITRTGSNENAIVFAARRARTDILKALLKKTGSDVLWERRTSGYRLAYHVLGMSVEYIAKIHSDQYLGSML